MSDDEQLGKPVRDYASTFSVATVLKETFLMTAEERDVEAVARAISDEMVGPGFSQRAKDAGWRRWKQVRIRYARAALAVAKERGMLALSRQST